ncbi:MAG: YciI family protein [Rhodoluna sp.]
MKQFLINVLDSNTGSATGDEISEIDAFNEMLQSNGHWVYANGISDPSEAVQLDNRNDKNEQIDAPLYSENTYVSGFWIIKAEDKLDAIRLGKLGSKACNRRVEVRPLHG